MPVYETGFGAGVDSILLSWCSTAGEVLEDPTITLNVVEGKTVTPYLLPGIKAELERPAPANGEQEVFIPTDYLVKGMRQATGDSGWTSARVFSLTSPVERRARRRACSPSSSRTRMSSTPRFLSRRRSRLPNRLRSPPQSRRLSPLRSPPQSRALHPVRCRLLNRRPRPLRNRLLMPRLSRRRPPRRLPPRRPARQTVLPRLPHPAHRPRLPRLPSPSRRPPLNRVPPRAPRLRRARSSPPSRCSAPTARISRGQSPPTTRIPQSGSGERAGARRGRCSTARSRSRSRSRPTAGTWFRERSRFPSPSVTGPLTPSSTCRPSTPGGRPTRGATTCSSRPSIPG